MVRKMGLEACVEGGWPWAFVAFGKSATHPPVLCRVRRYSLYFYVSLDLFKC